MFFQLRRCIIRQIHKKPIGLISLRNIKTSSVHHLPRLNPLLWGWTRNDYFHEINLNLTLSSLRSSMAERYTPKLADVHMEEKDNKAIIYFETVDYPVNVFSLDMLEKIHNLLYTPIVLNKEIVVFQSKKPGSFIHRDDYELINKLTKAEYLLYTEAVKTLTHIGFTLTHRPHAFVSVINGPCYDTGFSMVLSGDGILTSNSSQFSMGYNTYKKYNLIPIGSVVFNLLTRRHPFLGSGLLVEGYNLNPTQAYRLRMAYQIDDYRGATNENDIIKLEGLFSKQKHNALQFFYGLKLLNEGAYHSYIHPDVGQFKNFKAHPKFTSRSAYYTMLWNFMPIPYSLLFLWNMFSRRLRMNFSDFKFIKLLYLCCRRYYNVDYFKLKSYLYDDKASEYLFKSKITKKKLQLGVREIQYFDTLPHYTADVSKNITIFGDGSLSKQIIYSNIKNEYFSFITTYLSSSEERMKFKSSLLNLFERMPSSFEQYYTFWTKEVLCPETEATERKNQLNYYVKIYEGGPKSINDSTIWIDNKSLECQKNTLNQIEPICHKSSIIYVPTLSVPLSEICNNLSSCERIIGLSSLLPFNNMEYCEYIFNESTSEEIKKKALSLSVFNPNRTILIVKDSPGFFATRVFYAALDEYLLAVSRGASPRIIDLILKNSGFSFRFGEAIDKIGIDSAYKIGQHLSQTVLPNFNLTFLKRLLDTGALGVENYKGIYKYESNHQQSFLRTFPSLSSNYSRVSKYSINKINPMFYIDVEKRIIYSIINESIKCLEEGVVPSAQSIDTGAVNGVGFPRVLGGPCGYVDTVSAKTIVSQLEALYSKTKNPKFYPCSTLKLMAENNIKFYS